MAPAAANKCQLSESPMVGLQHLIRGRQQVESARDTAGDYFLPVGYFAVRVFFCIAPDAVTAARIDNWCALCWPAIPRRIPVQNYHITTAFIGEADDRDLLKLSHVFEDFEQPCFELEINDVGYWSDTRTLWVGPKRVPDALSRLHLACRKAANRIGTRGGGRRYQPHLTLAKKLTVPPASALVDPDFSITVNELQLWSSTRHAHGASYQVLGTWRLD